MSAENSIDTFVSSVQMLCSALLQYAVYDMILGDEWTFKLFCSYYVNMCQNKDKEHIKVDFTDYNGLG